MPPARCGNGRPARRCRRPCSARLDRPTPRVALGRALRGIASSCIDVSDGLLADLAHICRASGVGAEVDVDALPASAALRAAFDPDTRRVLQAAGGDDYELCFTVPATAADALGRALAEAGTGATRIGTVTAGAGVRPILAGAAWSAPATGWQHFA